MPGARYPIDEAALLKLTQSVPDGDARCAKSLHQSRLAAQLLAGAVTARQDFAAQMLQDLPVLRLGVFGTTHAASCYIRFLAESATCYTEGSSE